MPISAPHGCDSQQSIQKSLWIVAFIAIPLILLSSCSNSGSASAAGGAGAPPGKGGGRRGGGGGDVPVTVAVVSLKNVPVEVQVIGNVEAYSTISMKAQVPGQLTEVHFHEGDFVKKG